LNGGKKKKGVKEEELDGGEVSRCRARGMYLGK